MVSICPTRFVLRNILCCFSYHKKYFQAAPSLSNISKLIFNSKVWNKPYHQCNAFFKDSPCSLMVSSFTLHHTKVALNNFGWKILILSYYGAVQTLRPSRILLNWPTICWAAVILTSTRKPKKWLRIWSLLGRRGTRITNWTLLELRLIMRRASSLHVCIFFSERKHFAFRLDREPSNLSSPLHLNA